MTTPLLVSIFLFSMLMAGITVYGYRRYAKPARIYAQLGKPVTEMLPPLIQDGTAPKASGLAQLLQQIGAYVPISPGDASTTKHSLMMAGYRAENAVTAFYGVKVAASVVLVLLVLALRKFLPPEPQKFIMLLVAGGGLGYFLPGFLLEKQVTARQTRLRMSLPDALDLMVISVEAGLGLDQAILHVSKELHLAHPELSNEWSLVNLEMRAGKRRTDALRNLAERTGEPELKKLIAMLVQNDRFGTGLAESLRAHSDFMRTKRKQDAEERAGKVGVKLVFPIFFFILPAMMIVTAGPAILQLFKELFPMMRKLS
jgi:tight adherence protein C